MSIAAGADDKEHGRVAVGTHSTFYKGQHEIWFKHVLNFFLIISRLSHIHMVPLSKFGFLAKENFVGI